MRAASWFRYAQLMVGLTVFGAGIGAMIRSDLGLPPWDVFHQGVSFRTPLSIGTATIATSFVVLLGWIPLRERPGIGTLANAVTIGVVVDVFLALVGEPSTAWERWGLLLGGLAVVGIGSGMYIGARLGPGPRDGLMTGISRLGPSIRLARTGIEALVLVAGWSLGGTVGVGTLVFALGIGPIVQFFLPRFDLPAP
jgi:uncharacterized membrane protein YczE